MSAITEFYLHDGIDNKNRTLNDYLRFSYENLETTHDFIQWMFPLNETSNYNELAPILTKDDINIIIDNNGQQKIINSFLFFYDFLLENRSWIYSIPNHNWLRISRVIKCLRLFNLDSFAQSFHQANMILMKLPEHKSVDFWKEALSKELWSD